MTAPTAERLATLVRFHANCRPDAGCETCEVMAISKLAVQHALALKDEPPSPANCGHCGLIEQLLSHGRVCPVGA